MSIEFQLAWPCPHLTVEEVVPLSNDRMTLNPRQSVAAMGPLRLLVNDEVVVPREGVFSAAVLYSTVSGPYDILQNEDEFIVETSSGWASLVFGVRGVTRLTTDQVIRRMQFEGWAHVEARNEDGHLVLIDPNAVGPHAWVKVSGSGAGALGFGHPEGRHNGRQWVAYGKEVYPGWDLFLRPDTVASRAIQFRRRIKSNPVFKVTYSMPVNRCLRCQTGFVENDMRYDASGDMIIIQNEDLLYQAALKMLLTDRGSNRYFPWYGTTIRERIGSKALSGVASVLSEDVRRSLSRLQALQTDQAKYQPVSFRERLYGVLSINVQRHVEDPTTFLIDVVVQNASAQPISLNIVFTVPETVALMGSNGLMMGTQAVGLDHTRGLFKNDRNLLTGGQ